MELITNLPLIAKIILMYTLNISIGITIGYMIATEQKPPKPPINLCNNCINTHNFRTGQVRNHR